MSAAETPLEVYVDSNLGKGALNDLRNQSRGGNNNSKGNRLEQRFATYKIAQIFGDNPDHDVEISSQDTAFVDDLITIDRTTGYKKSYQLKDSKSVYWNGKKGIKQYFKRQYRIDRDHHGIDDTKLELVIADKGTYERRNKDIPHDIQAYTNCTHFPNPESVNELLLTCNDYRIAIGKLSPWPNETDKLEHVAQLLIGAWASHNNVLRNSNQLIEKARESGNPSYILPGTSNAVIDEKTTNYLDQFEELRYEIKGDRLNYYFNGFSGFVMFEVGTKEFQGMCEQIISQNPQDIKALLMLLMGNGE